MDDTIHYLTYDPDEIWTEITRAYIEQGGDALYPGDEKEMLLRSVQAVMVQAFAGIDNALRMQTVRYAAREYLDMLGEARGCARISAANAEADVTITFRATGAGAVIPAGTKLTHDGQTIYELAGDVVRDGAAGSVGAVMRAVEPGTQGNGLASGTQMQTLYSIPAISQIVTASAAAGGADAEGDEEYRERIRARGLTSVTTGPARQYRAAAMGVSAEILDAKAVSASAGCVAVYLLLDDGADENGIIADVTAALSDESVRPLTDTLTVSAAAEIEYTLNAAVTAPQGANIESGVISAITEYRKWQDETIGRAFNPDRLMTALYNAGAVRVVWGAGSAFNAGTVQYVAIDAAKRCKGTIAYAITQE